AAKRELLRFVYLSVLWSQCPSCRLLSFSYRILFLFPYTASSFRFSVCCKLRRCRIRERVIFVSTPLHQILTCCLQATRQFKSDWLCILARESEKKLGEDEY